MDLGATIEAVQREVGARPDRKPGPETWAKIAERLLPKEKREAIATSAALDDRSERNIASLHPRVQPLARALALAGRENGMDVRILSGTRSYEEQNALFAKGRDGKGGKIVTNARAGFSNHNFGIAFDCGLFEGNKYLDDEAEGNPLESIRLSRMYAALGGLGKNLGLSWGGDWKSIVDEPHFELRPDWARGLSEEAMLAGLRARKNEGRDAFA